MTDSCFKFENVGSVICIITLYSLDSFKTVKNTVFISLAAFVNNVLSKGSSSKNIFCYTGGEGELAVSNWLPGEPRYGSGCAVITNEKYAAGWKSVNCSSRHTTLCRPISRNL